MPASGARVGGVEFAVRDAVERHGASAGANHGREDEQEGAPAGPAAIIPRRQGHGRQGKGQCENRVAEFDKSSKSPESALHRGSFAGTAGAVKRTGGGPVLKFNFFSGPVGAMLRHDQKIEIGSEEEKDRKARLFTNRAFGGSEGDRTEIIKL